MKTPRTVRRGPTTLAEHRHYLKIAAKRGAEAREAFDQALETLIETERSVKSWYVSTLAAGRREFAAANTEDGVWNPDDEAIFKLSPHWTTLPKP